MSSNENVVINIVCKYMYKKALVSLDSCTVYDMIIWYKRCIWKDIMELI